MAVPTTLKRATHPADQMKFLTEAIAEERHKIQECLAMIEQYSEALRKVSADTGARLATRDE